MTVDSDKIAQRNKRVAIYTVLSVCFMVGLTYASVPLYDLFCRVTGYGGTTQQAEEASNVVLDRDVTIRFDASTNAALPWDFDPVQLKVEMKVGQNGVAFYRAKNTSDEIIKGTATFNVTPQKAGPYFVKVDCFCFTEQVLRPGEEVDMPVEFYVDPEIAEDPHMDDIKTITLSYTFFRLEEEEDEVQDTVENKNGISPVTAEAG
ncbi:cytochrome c oxidase assembly protein [Curvivirga aplysinae]|uniref:cytochrome c oxidase assembly protein n=1 Tax=Curvivirga aplysinae TaxID=2529852 RepID=UPI0012BCFF88|nr:cytochrome c oxidase assembly protein [Curvivirga aplysinae]MTI11338.1 cytochrome c oxidase assembly protein [Curvivirga aplysinae]